MAGKKKELTAAALRRFRDAHAGADAIAAGHAVIPVPEATPDPALRSPVRLRSVRPRAPAVRPDPPPELRAQELLGRERLVQRWRCGSDASFFRAERDGLLVPRRDGARTGYSWADVFAFEGGQPPAGCEEDYRQDLLIPEEVAALTPYGVDTIIKRARRGDLPFRRVGRAWRFVPAEVSRWLASWS